MAVNKAGKKIACMRRDDCIDSVLSGTLLEPAYIHKHNLPLAVPAATQSKVGWNLATAGTAVIPSPPSWANCSPFAE